MKHSDTRYEKTGTLICGNTQPRSLLNRSTTIYACARTHYTGIYSTYTQLRVHAHIHSHSSHFAKVLMYDSNMASRVYTAKWLKENEWQRDSESAIWLLILAMCRKVEKKVSCMREIYPSPWWADCKQLHTLYSRCMLWSMIFHCFSILLKKHDRRSIKRRTSQNLFEHFEIHLWFILNPIRLSYSSLCTHMAA